MILAPNRVMFLYWGRRGALSRFALELSRAAQSLDWLESTLSVSRQNESFHAFKALGPSLFPVSTFESRLGALAGAPQLVMLRRALTSRLLRDQTEMVVALMPHVWSQLIVDIVHRAGARYVTIVHDAVHHPGDKSPRLHQWLLREASVADRVITLSRTVASQLIETGRVPAHKVSSTFLPDIDYGAGASLAREDAASPFRILFFGRVLAYKGLARLVEAIERLRSADVNVSLGVYGEGALGELAPRLEAIGAEVVNRWIPESEVAAVFQRYHAVALSHSEASQSGVAAAAFGAGVPVVAVPVGGIVEQVHHGETGLLAPGTDAASLAETIAALASDPALHRTLRAGILRTRPQRSMERFLSELIATASAEERERDRRSA